MREIVIGDRAISITHVKIETSVYGDIQRYRVEISGSTTSSGLAIMRSSSAVDARVMASAIDQELLHGYDGNEECGLLRDAGVREWRDENRALIEEALQELQVEVTQLPPEPVGESERILRRAFGLDDGEPEDAYDA